VQLCGHARYSKLSIAPESIVTVCLTTARIFGKSDVGAISYIYMLLSPGLRQFEGPPESKCTSLLS